MNYETIPQTVEAHQQQIVSAHVPTGDSSIQTANPGDWIVRWPDGKIEVYGPEDFRRKFRRVPGPEIRSQIETLIRN